MINLLLVFLFLFSPLLFVLYSSWEALGVAWTSAAAIATFMTALAALSTAFAVSRGNRETRKVAEATRKATEATRKATEATGKAAEGQLFMQIMTAYSSKEMLLGMRELIQFEDDHRKNYAKDFGEMLRKNDPKVMECDAARRRFDHWSLAVHKLREHKFISENLFVSLWGTNQENFYQTYIVPLKPAIKRDMEERKKRRKDAINEKTNEKTG